MTTRFPTRFSTVWLGPLVLLALLFALDSGAPATALAGTPYQYKDSSEGDPGDGVLDPRARERVEESTAPSAVLAVDRLAIRPPLPFVVAWFGPLYFPGELRLFDRPWHQVPSHAGPPARFLPSSRRGWPHAR
jgi:hypothetical protein